nr:rod shape-determining protein [Desulfobulbaceae bacterium]
MREHRLLNVGIDLGTSRSVIACDNGIRTYVASCIGYPKDAISQKFLGSNAIYGDEAIKNRMALNIFRPFEGGLLKYTDDEADPEGYQKAVSIARELLKYLLTQISPDKQTIPTKIRAVIGTPALASKKNKKSLMTLSKGLVESVMIASEPFCVAYGLNILHNSIVVDIGAGTVDLCRMSGALPNEEDQITTHKAGNAIDEALLNLITAKYPEANLSVNMIKKFKEDNATITSRSEVLEITLPINGKPTKLDVTDEVKQACRSIVPDIVEGIQALVAKFDPEFQEELKANIILAGGGSQMIGLRQEIEKYMQEHLGSGKVRKVEEPLYAGANGALMLCKDMPEEYWKELESSALVSK